MSTRFFAEYPAPGGFGHSSRRPAATEIEALFRAEFFAEFNTLLLGGGDEPVYLPADESTPFHRLVYRADYVSSALHEIAHWCIAGDSRRLLVDFGYWYAPEDRNTEQQQNFEQAELKPQALEWCFSAAANIEFQVSVDNFAVDAKQRQIFSARVRRQLERYLQTGLPDRAVRFHAALLAQHGGLSLPDTLDFPVGEKA